MNRYGLKPCLACGERSKLKLQTHLEGGWSVLCGGCGLAPHWPGAATENVARFLWNMQRSGPVKVGHVSEMVHQARNICDK